MEKLKWRVTWGQLSVGTIEWGQLSDHVGTGTKNSIVPKTSHPIGLVSVGEIFDQKQNF